MALPTQKTWKMWVLTGENKSQQTCHSFRLTGTRSSDTWNEPHPDAGQREPDHTSHAPPPLSSPPSQHVNDGPLRNNASVDLNRYHDTSRQLPHESLPANTNYQAPSRQAPTSNTWQPILSRDPLPQPSHSRESFVPTTAHQSTTEQGTRNQTLLQPYGYEIDHEAVVTDSDDDAVMPPRRRSAVNGSPVDLTQSPDMATASASQQSRTRKRSSASRGDEGSAKKRAKRTSMSTARVDAEDLEDEAPSADAELLQAQQREALKMQETKKDDEPVKIGQRTCIICLENYTNATTAICGTLMRAIKQVNQTDSTYRPHLLPRMLDARSHGI